MSYSCRRSRNLQVRKTFIWLEDLQDTLLANRETCVGLAANMIGVQKRVIIFNLGLVPMVMFNPILLSYKGPYETEEGCLSLTGGATYYSL